MSKAYLCTYSECETRGEACCTHCQNPCADRCPSTVEKCPHKVDMSRTGMIRDGVVFIAALGVITVLVILIFNM